MKAEALKIQEEFLLQKNNLKRKMTVPEADDTNVEEVKGKNPSDIAYWSDSSDSQRASKSDLG